MKAMKSQLESLASSGKCVPPPETSEYKGQTTARVFPLNPGDVRQKPDMTIDIWMKPGKPATQGQSYKDGQSEGGNFNLCLGASNFDFLGWNDALYLQFNENKVVFIKWPDTLQYISKVFDHVMKPLIDRGYMGHGCCSLEVARHMSASPLLDSMHMTGGEPTYQAIRKTFTKPFSCELGCVSPYIVVPGEEGADWSDQEVEHHASHLAWGVHLNNGAVCFSPKILLVSKHWAKKDQFVEFTKKCLSSSLAMPAWFPGMQQRQEAFLKQYPQAEVRKPAKVDALFNYDEKKPYLPWIFNNNVSHKDGEYALVNEPFCPMLTVVELECTDPSDFMSQATAFANNKLPGNLAATMICHHDTESKYAEAVNEALAGLKYGTVSLNANITNTVSAHSNCWGGFPGNTPENPQSGMGVVYNSFMFDHPEKTVSRCKFFNPTVQNRLDKPAKLPPGLPLCKVILDPSGLNIAKLIGASIGWPKVAVAGGLFLAGSVFVVSKLVSLVF